MNAQFWEGYNAKLSEENPYEVGNAERAMWNLGRENLEQDIEDAKN